MSHEIFVQLAEERRDYSILIGKSVFAGDDWLPKKKFSQIVIITDHDIEKLYGLRLQTHLCDAGRPTLLFSFPAGEQAKNYQTKQKIENAMQKHRCDRDTLILALGGGVTGDLAGFIAATYARGIAYVQIPTSLLATARAASRQTGINTRYGKI